MNIDEMTLDQLKVAATKPFKGQRVDSLNHLDAGEAAFFQLQLTYIQRQQLEVKHKPLRAAQFIPVSAEAPPGAESIKIRYYDVVGEAKWVSDYASDFPAANTYGSEKTFNIEGIGVQYTYSIQEIRRAQMAGIPLDQRSAMAAERSINEFIDDKAWYGDAKVGIYGLLKYPGVTTYTVPAVGTGSSTLWSTKTPDQIIADVTGMLTAVHTATNGKEMPNTLLLPRAEFNRLAGLRTGTYNDKTVLAYLEENLALLGLTEIDWINESVNIGTTGNIPAGQTASNRAVVYVKDPEHLRLELPIAFESFAPQLEGMVYKIPCYARTAGVISYYPLSIAYADGI
jgi:hypothetical protein